MELPIYTIFDWCYLIKSIIPHVPPHTATLAWCLSVTLESELLNFNINTKAKPQHGWIY